MGASAAADRAIRSQSFFEQKKLKKRISASIPNANSDSLELSGIISLKLS
jgi:hypothetical protein